MSTILERCSGIRVKRRGNEPVADASVLHAVHTLERQFNALGEMSTHKRAYEMNAQMTRCGKGHIERTQKHPPAKVANLPSTSLGGHSAFCLGLAWPIAAPAPALRRVPLCGATSRASCLASPAIRPELSGQLRPGACPLHLSCTELNMLTTQTKKLKESLGSCCSQRMLEASSRNPRRKRQWCTSQLANLRSGNPQTCSSQEHNHRL